MTDFTKPCTCKSCKDKYVPTPWRDYYNSTTNENGLCETCLVTQAGLDPAKTVTVLFDEA